MSTLIDFDVVKKSGLRQRTELEELFGVTYAMVNRYMSGKSFPRGDNRRLISKTVHVIEGLLSKGQLPFSEDKDTESRLRAVKKIRAFVAAQTN